MNQILMLLINAVIIFQINQETKAQYKIENISKSQGIETIKSLMYDLEIDLIEINNDRSFILTSDLEYVDGFSGSEKYRGKLLFRFNNDCIEHSWKNIMQKTNTQDWHEINSMGIKGEEFIEQIYMMAKMSFE